MKPFLSERDIRLKLMMSQNDKQLYTVRPYTGITFTEDIALMTELCDANWLLMDILRELSKLSTVASTLGVYFTRKKGKTNGYLYFKDMSSATIVGRTTYKVTDFPLFDWQHPDNIKDTLPALTMLFDKGRLSLAPGLTV